MDRHEINVKIAEILGFKKYPIKVNGVEKADFAWSYPTKFASQQCGTPEYELPDFVTVIENAIKANLLLGGSGILPFDYHS